MAGWEYTSTGQEITAGWWHLEGRINASWDKVPDDMSIVIDNKYIREKDSVSTNTNLT